MSSEPIAILVEGWKRELPDLDVRAMATVAMLNRVAGLVRRQLEHHLAADESTLAEFDVLSALRRSGPPYEMKPSAIARATMLSPSGMTHRLDQLVAAGLVERVVDPDSRRTAPVVLTDRGRQKSERLARAVVEIEQQCLRGLDETERRDLDELLVRALDGLDPGDPGR